MIHWNKEWSARIVVCTAPEFLGVGGTLPDGVSLTQAVTQVTEAIQAAVKEAVGQRADEDPDPHNWIGGSHPTRTGIDVEYYRKSMWVCNSSLRGMHNQMMLAHVPQGFRDRMNKGVQAGIKARRQMLKQLGVKHEAP